MDNFVEIKYDKNEIYPEIFINGEIISRYMSLSDYIYEDIFCWSENFFDIMDSELGENYRVSLIGHKYHEIVLRQAMANSQYCKELTFEENKYKISLADKYKYALEINKKYSLISENFEWNVKFLCKSSEKFESLDLPELFFDTHSSNYSISFDGDADEIMTKYSVIIAEKNGVVKHRDIIKLYVTKANLSVLIDYFNTYHIRLCAIKKIFSKMDMRSFDDADMAILEFDAYSKEEYRFVIDDIPKRLELETRFEIAYDYFPKCFDLPKIEFISSDPSVVSCENGVLIAKNIGTCIVSATDDSGVVYKSEQIEVFKSNYITNIIVELPSETLKIGEMLTFTTLIIPSDAEDIGEITYSVSDESVAVITGHNQLYALAPGRVCVKIATPRLERKFFINIPPQPTELIVSEENIELIHSSERTVYCSIVPADVSPDTRVVWSVSNKSIIRIKGCNSKRCCIVTAGEGTAILLCRIEGTNIIKKIGVTVKKSKGCYVATSVYGSYDCPEVWVLRRFRDNFLVKYWAGRRFIDMYYAISPKALKLFGKQKWFNFCFKVWLDRLVSYLQKRGYKKTPYED